MAHTLGDKDEKSTDVLYGCGNFNIEVVAGCVIADFGLTN